MPAPVKIEDLAIDAALHEFVVREVLPGTGIDADTFWSGFAALVRRLAPRNAQLLAKRDVLQSSIDTWHRARPGARFDGAAYQDFLRSIDYVLPEPPAFSVTPTQIDAEISQTAGPQLVVPVSNARYALNAANARWGSLYDALYGTDAIAEDGGAERGAGYNPRRGARVIDFARRFLDSSFPLTSGTHREALGYAVTQGGLQVRLPAGGTATLTSPGALAGFNGDAASPSLILLLHHGLYVELHLDREHPIGRDDPAGISDVVLESAVTTIQDCEDSVSAVTVAEKIGVYRNWLGLMQGTLQATFEKDGRSVVRRLNADRRYRTLGDEVLVLPGRSLMFVRNVGHHMLCDAITWQGAPVPETFIDAAVTTLAALHDLRLRRNSRTGSIYIVKPKMHGPEEVALADDLFEAIEELLRLPKYTLKIGIMDEERRTTVNLARCIHAARQRVAFINTGFLDRTGDEIHTSMEAGAVPRKSELKKARWLDAYERRNVDIGLACGLEGKAQIGKGMWAMPDLMADMLKVKVSHLLAGANTSWVPSPTAATLHALHYHEVDVAAVQRSVAQRPPAALADILTPALVDAPSWSTAEIEEELNTNAQSILGYVVRWIDAGVGCSKVPDYHDVALMEDRATLRISSQHVANWLRHGVCTREAVLAALRRMAAVVDRQNETDPHYRSMSTDLQNSIAFRAACDLIFTGTAQPNGYTEAVLSARRREELLRTASTAH
ncbi:MAG: malate synthase G [Steroidobacteraceae bacterium]